MKYFSSRSRGVALLMILLIMGLLVAIGVGVASIFTREIQITGFTDDSVGAILAADAGIEKMLYYTRVMGGSPDTTFTRTLANDAEYETCPTPTSCQANPSVIITSEGELNSTKRSLEVTY
jgi:Tfp pilus assembly protein PilX